MEALVPKISPDIDERNSSPILAHDGVCLPLSATKISDFNSKEKSSTDSPSITNNTAASTRVASRHGPMTYNTGYGDMCFGRIIERRSSASANSDSLGNNVLFIELDGFTRSGPFPFLKLPLEIRLKIYLYLLGPFHSSDGKSKAPHIQIQVERFCRPFDYNGHITGTYEEYLQKLSHVPVFDEKVSQKPEERWDDRAEFERKKWAKIQLGKSHPLRSGCYTISCDPYLSERSATKDWSMIQLVRDMSNVSRQIRTEFSFAFWTRVSIICPEEFDFAELPNVLKDRPMACVGILSFDVNIQDCNEDELSRFFDAVTQHLNLDGLTLSLMVGDRELKDMTEGKGKFLWLQKIKLVKVAVYFDLNMYYYPDDFDGDDWEEFTGRVLKEQEPTLRQRLMPNTLSGRPVGRSQRQQYEDLKLQWTKAMSESESDLASDDSDGEDMEEDDTEGEDTEGMENESEDEAAIAGELRTEVAGSTENAH